MSNHNINCPFTKPLKSLLLTVTHYYCFSVGSLYFSKLHKNSLIDRVNTCGATVPNNCSYIQNPNYPSSESAGSCTFNIKPLNSDVCQLRMDFDNFDLTETSPIVGTCVDTFDVTSGSSRDYFALCGTLSGQHSKFTSFLRLLGTFSNREMSFV